MTILTNAVWDERGLHLARVCWALAALFGLLSLAVLFLIPEVSLLAQPDGKSFFYINRDFDLPTGDPALFHDYSLEPLGAAIASCSAFYLLSGALFWARQLNEFPAGDRGTPSLLRAAHARARARASVLTFDPLGPGDDDQEPDRA